MWHLHEGPLLGSLREGRERGTALVVQAFEHAVAKQSLKEALPFWPRVGEHGGATAFCNLTRQRSTHRCQGCCHLGRQIGILSDNVDLAMCMMPF